MSTSVKADVNTLEYTVQAYRAAFEKLKGVENILFFITFEPIPVSMIESSVSRGGNSLGLMPEDGPVVVVLLYTSWENETDDERVYGVNKDTLASIEEEA